jgi:hypothetical protein
MAREEALYAPDGITKTVKSEDTHTGRYRVGTVSITPESR